jgi:nucleotide-binding universal stress UspA family protein
MWPIAVDGTISKKGKEETVKKILVATDGSPSALQAVELGLELAAEQEAKLIFVHVAPHLEVLPFPVTGIGSAPVKVAREPNDHDLEPLRKAIRLAEERALPSESRLLVGDPAKKIVELAESIRADLIVAGSHGHGAFSSALLGSVSHGILHRATRPVLIVREARQPVEVLV